MNTTGTRISPPWISYYRKVNALFGDDPDIRIEYDDENNVITMYVSGQDKADAISQLLPERKTFGNVTIETKVIPANGASDRFSMMKYAFVGNPKLAFIWKTDDAFMTNPVTYVSFKPEVAQFFDDNLHDAHGNRSMLYEDIAKELLGEDGGVFFCTDKVSDELKTGAEA